MFRCIHVGLDPLLNYAVDDPVPQWSCPTVDEILIVLGLLGLGSLTSTVKDTPLNGDPTIGVVCGKNLCASENDNRTRQGQTPKRERWWPTYWTANGELPRGSQLSRHLAPRAWPSPPPEPGRPVNLMGGPRWTSVEEYGGRTKRFQGAPQREQFLEIGVAAF